MALNAYACVILAAFVGDYLLSMLSTVLNLSRLSPEIPTALAGYYDEVKYGKSQQYTRARSRVGLVIRSVDLAALLLFWFLRGFAALDTLLRAAHLHTVLTGLLYIAILSVCQYLVLLPASMYFTFVVEERFGFNQTTRGTFAKDQLKGLALTTALGGPALAAVLALFHYCGAWAWVWAFLGLTALDLALVALSPHYLLPLFVSLVRLPEGDLRAAILRLAQAASFDLRDVYVIDGSTRSSHSNAFFAGFGRYKRICLFDTLLERHSREEILAVLAHEIGHYKRRHVLQNLAVGVAHRGTLLFLLGRVLLDARLARAFYVDRPSVYVGVVLASLLYTPAEMLLGVLMNTLSRHNEFEADAYSAELTKRPTVLAEALKKLSKDNLSNLTPHALHVFLRYSHPPVLARVAALERWRAAHADEVPEDDRAGPGPPEGVSDSLRALLKGEGDKGSEGDTGKGRIEEAWAAGPGDDVASKL